ERRVDVLDHQVTRLAAILQALVAREHPRQQTRLAQDLKAIAGAEHEPAPRDEIAERRDHRRAPGHRTGAQVIAVREAAGQDHAVELAELALAMPDVAYGLMQYFGDDVVEIAVAPRPRKYDDAESHRALILACGSARGKVVHGFDREILQDRVRQELAAHLADAGARALRRRLVQVDVDDLAHAQIVELGESEAGQRALHRRALDIHDARLEPHEDARSHAAAVTRRR